ncbi:uncharacterized protein LOC107689943 [Sinocyclocheilus anshuiensis]|uniref:uncharacterized protein LOC107689943 n=1 Tax=Sinocyclocheilus anshuiensis TaxID=1608454 RepID=UPI0007B79426|nr:PREDICTED: uncharacterized protein LOC107689943 [Sinocyclocheilus anshuiensis]
MIHDLENEEEFPPLPLTPSKPPIAKKPTLSQFSADNLRSDEIVAKLAHLINTRSDALEEMVKATRGEIKDLKEKLGFIERRVEISEQSTLTCMNRVVDMERYSRRWNMKVHGIPEAVKENVREEVIRICQEVLPQEREQLPAVIDVAHRLGSKRLNESRPRAVIVRFAVRRYREAVWKAAKNSPFLRDHGLRFTEDLTKEDRDSRQKLWPLIKKAREEGKSAYLAGGRGFIDGVEL